MKEQAKISKRKNQQKIGKEFRVLFEGFSQESDLLFQGRLEGQAQEIDGYILINDMPENLSQRLAGFITSAFPKPTITI
jgi:ribosomal protein S12 methylthiotransferase